MESVIRVEPWDVRQRLGQLGLTVDLLFQVVQACQAARGGSTDNDPPSAPGWLTWQMGTRRFRELLRPLGWEKDDTENLSTVVNHALQVRIAVTNTDDGTGLPHLTPSNKSRKGSCSEKAADQNAQMPLPLPGFMEAFEAQVRAAAIPGYATYFLCVYISGEEVRAELPYPIGFSAGHFRGWKERIIFLSWTGLAGVHTVDADKDGFAPDAEVTIHRRA
jgi:hypothetical protein